MYCFISIADYEWNRQYIICMPHGYVFLYRRCCMQLDLWHEKVKHRISEGFARNIVTWTLSTSRKYKHLCINRPFSLVHVDSLFCWHPWWNTVIQKICRYFFLDWVVTLDNLQRLLCTSVVILCAIGRCANLFMKFIYWHQII